MDTFATTAILASRFQNPPPTLPGVQSPQQSNSYFPYVAAALAGESVASSSSQADNPFPSNISSAAGDSPAQNQQHQASGSGTPAGTGSGEKQKKQTVPKKRKSTATAATEAGGDDEDDEEKKKRTKTTRACDQCRRKKIRCDAIAGTEPPLCVHCRAHSHECTWFLPITETRFKRQRPPKEPKVVPSPLVGLGQPQQLPDHNINPPSPSSFSQSYPPLPPLSNLLRTSQQQAYASQPLSATSPPIFNQLLQRTASPSQHSPHSNASSPDYSNGSGPSHKKQSRILGPTSIGHLMHSTSTFPVERMEPVDIKYSQTLTVDDRGDGIIRVITASDGESPQGGPLAIQGIEHGDAEKLLNHFFNHHSSHFPIVSRADFLSTASPTPLLFNTLCGVSALSHTVSPSILRTVKANIRGLLRDDDLLENTSIATIQALLIYGFSLELEKGTAGSKSWNAVGLAIRKAQDLGLHRKLGSERKEQSEADHTELRRRVWGGCLIADRWIAAIFGQPMMIDLADCDALLPSVFDIRPNLEFDAENRPYLFNSALLALSVILGRILKMVYSPTGIMTLASEDADQLIADLNAWHADIPEELQFNSPDSATSSAGFLHLLYIPVRFLVTRPFMRISFQLPERFSNISVGMEQWMKMEKESREAIYWVGKNQAALEGWFVGTYAYFIACLIQYHTHIRQRDARSLDTLRYARDTLKCLVVPDGECHARNKISEIVHLLYNTACSVKLWAPETTDSNSPGTSNGSSGGVAAALLNPTVGVRQREQDWHPPRSRPGMQAAYSSSLRSTHVPGESETELDTPSSQPYSLLLPSAPVAPDLGSGLMASFPDSLNFNPTLNTSNTPSGNFFDSFLESDSTALFPDSSVLDWGSWSSFFQTVPGGPPTF